MKTRRVDPDKPGEPFIWVDDWIKHTRMLSYYQRAVVMEAYSYHWRTGNKPADLTVWRRLCPPRNQHEHKELRELIEMYDDLETTKTLAASRLKSLRQRRNKSLAGIFREQGKSSEINETDTQLSDNLHTKSTQSAHKGITSSSSSPSSKQGKQKTNVGGVNGHHPQAAARLTFSSKAAAAMFTALNDLFIGSKEHDLARWAEALAKRAFTPEEIAAWPTWLQASGFTKGTNLFGLEDTINDYQQFLREPPLWERSPAVRFVFLTCGHKVGDLLDIERRRAIIREGDNIERRHAEGLTKQEWKQRKWEPARFVQFWREAEEPQAEYPAPEKVSRLFSEFKNFVSGVK